MVEYFAKLKDPLSFGDDAQALGEVLASRKLSGTADVVGTYERALAQWFKARNCVAVSSGSAALMACLRVSGVGVGDEVILPATAPVPSILPVLALGAVPVFCDTNSTDFGLSLDDLRAKISSRTKCAVVVPIWGYPFPVSATRQVLNEHGLKLIEDAAQAHGTIIEGAYAGTHGDFGCFSTHDNKPLSTGEGGFVLTEDDALADSVRTLTRLGNLDGHQFGYNFKLGGLAAALGHSRLRHLDQVLREKRVSAEALIEELRELPLQELPRTTNSRANYYGLVMIADETLDAGVIRQLADAQGIESDILKYGYQVAYHRALFAPFRRDACVQAESLVSRIVTLPVQRELPEDYPKRVTSVLESVIASAKTRTAYA